MISWVSSLGRVAVMLRTYRQYVVGNAGGLVGADGAAAEGLARVSA